MTGKLCFDDGAYTVILNTKCDPEKVPERLKALYAYINDCEQVGGDPFIQKLDARVQKYNTPEWRRKQMTLEHLLERAEEQGIEKGTDQVNRLNRLLIQLDRIDDLKRSSSDPEYQKKLFEEFGI